MKYVLLFPGQGSQRVGMGKDLSEAYPEAREVFEAVDSAIGASVRSLAFDGPAEELTLTHNAQVALLAHSMAVWAVVRDAIGASAVAAAGHSLGEFSAYCAAGSLSLEDAARIVRRRGELMYETGLSRPGTMAAILGRMNTPVQEICERASKEAGTVVPANYNSDDQVVISGERDGVARAMELVREAGAKRCVPLQVSGAFHSPLMEPAVTGLDKAIRGATISNPSIPVYANVDAAPVSLAREAHRKLVAQLTSPVRWTAVMRALASDHPDAHFVELGPGNVLSGLAKRLVPQIRVTTCGTVEETMKLISETA